MKKALLIIATIAMLIYTAAVIIHDARTHQGAFMTAEQYREIVQEVHR